MGIQKFDNYDKYTDMCCRINKANHQDSKAMWEAGTKANFICGVFTGAHNKAAPDLESLKLICKLMGTM